MTPPLPVVTPDLPDKPKADSRPTSPDAAVEAILSSVIPTTPSPVLPHVEPEATPSPIPPDARPAAPIPPPLSSTIPINSSGLAIDELLRFSNSIDSANTSKRGEKLFSPKEIVGLILIAKKLNGLSRSNASGEDIERHKSNLKECMALVKNCKPHQIDDQLIKKMKNFSGIFAKCYGSRLNTITDDKVKEHYGDQLFEEVKTALDKVLSIPLGVARKATITQLQHHPQIGTGAGGPSSIH